MNKEQIQEKVEEFIGEHEDKIFGAVVFTGCMITGLIGIKLGKNMARNGIEVTKFVYGDKGNLCEKYVVRQIK